MAVGKILILESVSGQPKQAQAADTAYINLLDTAAAGTMQIGGNNVTQIDVAGGTGVTTVNVGNGTAVAAMSIGTGAALASLSVGTGMGAGDAINVGANALATLNLSGLAVNIGNAANTAAVDIKGNLTVQGTETVIGTSEFDDDAVFKGDVTFGDGLPVPPAHDTVTFAAGTEVTSNIVFGGATRTIDGGAPVAGGAGYDLTVKGGTATGAGPSVGGRISVTGGAGVGAAAGGSATLQGGASTATGTGGAAYVKGSNSLAGDGAAVGIDGGNAGGTGAFSGGSITLQPGAGVADLGSAGGDLFLVPGAADPTTFLRPGMVVFGDYANRWQTDFVPIFANSIAGPVDDTLAGLAWNQSNNSWYYRNQGASWLPLTGAGGVLPTGAAFQHLEWDATLPTPAWVAVNDIMLPNTSGVRNIQIDQVVTGNGADLNINAGGSNDLTGVNGGNLWMEGGWVSGAGSNGGEANVRGGTADAGGGAVNLYGGQATDLAGAGGNVNLEAGQGGTGTGTGGNVEINTGSAATVGDVIVKARVTGNIYIGLTPAPSWSVQASTIQLGFVTASAGPQIHIDTTSGSEMVTYFAGHHFGGTSPAEINIDNTNGRVISNITFRKEASYSILVDTSTTTNAAGGSLTVQAGNANGTGAGGDVTISGGRGGTSGSVFVGPTNTETRLVNLGANGSGIAAVTITNTAANTATVVLGAAGLWDDVANAGNVKLFIGKSTDAEFPIYANLATFTNRPGIRYDTVLDKWQVQTNGVAWQTLSAGGATLPVGAEKQVLQWLSGSATWSDNITLPNTAGTLPRTITVAQPAASGAGIDLTAAGGAALTSGAGGKLILNGGAQAGIVTNLAGNVQIGATNTTYVTLGSLTNGWRLDVANNMLEYVPAGTGNIRLPTQFYIAAVQASANVTATNLNTLTAGATSNADALHTHNGVGGFTKLAFVALTAGMPLAAYNDAGTAKVTKADASGAATHFTVGFATATVGGGGSEPVQTNGTIAIVAGLWDSGIPAAADIGKPVYNSPTTAGNVTITPYITSGKFIQKLGVVLDDAGTILIQIGDVITL